MPASFFLDTLTQFCVWQVEDAQCRGQGGGPRAAGGSVPLPPFDTERKLITPWSLLGLPLLHLWNGHSEGR